LDSSADSRPHNEAKLPDILASLFLGLAPKRAPFDGEPILKITMPEYLEA